MILYFISARSGHFDGVDDYAGPTPLTYDLDDDDDQSMIDEYEQYEQYEQYDDCGEFEGSLFTLPCFISRRHTNTSRIAATMDDQETGSINGETFNAIMEEQQSHIKTGE